MKEITDFLSLLLSSFAFLVLVAVAIFVVTFLVGIPAYFGIQAAIAVATMIV